MDLTLARWSLSHALALLCATALALVVGHAWPAALTAAISFAALMLGARGGFTPRGRFGLANGITSLRLAIVLGLGFGAAGAPESLLSGAVLAVFLLDGLDGWLARRSGTASA